MLPLYACYSSPEHCLLSGKPQSPHKPHYSVPSRVCDWCQAVPGFRPPFSPSGLPDLSTSSDLSFSGSLHLRSSFLTSYLIRSPLWTWVGTVLVIRISAPHKHEMSTWEEMGLQF